MQIKKRVLILGGKGFLGKNLKEYLDTNSSHEIIAVNTNDADLTSAQETRILYSHIKPKIIINCAAIVGGIGLNSAKPADLFYKNTLICVNAIHEANKLMYVEKFVQMGTVCSYGDVTKVPFCEDDLFKGYPSEENSYYGISRLSILSMLWAYRKQYDFNGIYLIPVNMVGPHDNFGAGAHVIPDLINKINSAKICNTDHIDVWGTGQASREFLYVKDCARAIGLAIEKYNKKDPVNIGTGQEIKICDLVQLLMEKMDYHGKVVYQTNKPDGQMQRRLDVSRAKTEFDFEAQTNLSTALDETLKWYYTT